MAPLLRRILPPSHLPIPLPPVPGNLPFIKLGLHLGTAQPGDPPQLPGYIGLYRAVSPIRVDGVQSGCARCYPEG